MLWWLSVLCVRLHFLHMRLRAPKWCSCMVTSCGGELVVIVAAMYNKTRHSPVLTSVLACVSEQWCMCAQDECGMQLGARVVRDGKK